MVLGLNESVSMQSMSVTIHALRSAQITWGWLATAFRRELVTALLLGAACGLVVGLVVWPWRNNGAPAFVIVCSIAPSVVTACGFCLGVSCVLQWFRLELRSSGGPIELA